MEAMPPTTFGECLRALRLAAGLSQEVLAERSGLSVRGISDLERGIRHRPQRETVRMLAVGLGCSVEDLTPVANCRYAPRPGHLGSADSMSLPRSLTSFVGRQAIVSVLDILVRRDDIRLLTLTGPGGVGKTRVALAVAEQVVDAFPYGVWFVNLAPLTDPAHVLPTIAQTLGIRVTGSSSVQETLVDVLRSKSALILLDNFEQVAAAALEVAELLEPCPGVTVLVTSRVPLRVQAEREYPIMPLEILPTTSASQLAAVEQVEAVALFAERAQAVRPDFQLTDDNVATVVAICERLDGLPLAIELAAARLKALSPTVLLERLSDRLGLLAGGPRDAPARHQTIRDAIAWSYDLLDPNEQRLFRQLAVFVDGWMLEAAEAVCDPDLDVFDTLAALIDHSLVQYAEQPDGSIRYTMLETIREFALEQLGATDQTDEVMRRLVTHLLHYFEYLVPERVGSRGLLWMARCEAERDNVRAALSWATTHDAESALRLNLLFSDYWWRRGLYGEARHWTELALRSGHAVSPTTRAKALFDSGYLATTQGDYATGRQHTEEGLTLFRVLGDIDGTALCQFGLGRIAMFTNDVDAALRLFEESAAVFRQTGHGWLAAALQNLGTVARSMGDYQGASRYLVESSAIARQSGDTAEIVINLTESGILALKRSDLRQADALLRESLILERDASETNYLVQTLEGVGWLAVAEEQPERAARLLGAASALRESFSMPVPPIVQREYDDYVPLAQAQIDTTTWEQAWSDGRMLSLGEAIDDALGSDSRPEQALLPEPPFAPTLSQREVEILRLIATGHSNKEIAAALSISVRTVERHITNLYIKINARNKADATAYAIRLSLV